MYLLGAFTRHPRTAYCGQKRGSADERTDERSVPAHFDLSKREKTISQPYREEIPGKKELAIQQ